jgi:hypothetical protein
MTDQFGFMDENDQFGQPNQQNGNKGLRDWAKSVQDENKDLKSQMAQIQAELRKQQAVNTFEDLGLPRAAAQLYNGDLTSEAINSWATQVRSAFGVTPTDAGQPAPQNTPPALTTEQQATFQNITQAGANAIPSTTLDDHQRSVNNAGSIQDLLNAWQGIQR